MSTPTFRRRGILALVAAAALLLPLAACSSDDDSAATTTSTEAAADTLLIGLEAPLTGSQSELGEGMLRGAELAAASLNADGGVLGRTVEIVPIDDAADPDTAEQAATAAVADGLDAVVGPYNSGAGARSLPIYIDAGLVPMRLTSADTTAGLGFTLQPMTSQIAPVAVTAVTDWADASTVAMIVDGSEGYTSEAAEATEALLTEAGVTIASVGTITPGASSYATEVAAAIASSPDLVYVVAYYPEAAAIAADMAAADTEATCMVDYGGFDTGYITDAGTTVAQTCSVLGVPSPADFPGSEPLIAAFDEAFGAPVGSWSPYTYDSVLLLADAIERAGSTDAEALNAALAATDSWSGWTGTVAFEAETGNRIPAPVTLNRVTDEGTFTVDDTWVEAVGFTF